MTIEKIPSDVPEIDLANYIIDPEVINLVPAALAEKFELIPLFKVGNNLTIAISNPHNIIAIDQVRIAAKMEVSVTSSDPKAIREAISEYYGISGLVEEIIKKYPRSDKVLHAKTTSPEEAPIVKLVNALVSQAVKERASDIHIEPEVSELRVRYRVDGVLHEELKIPIYMLSSIVSRVKILGGMDIAESRVPQDGRFEMTFEEKKIDFRVSTYPSVYGEKVVIRVLDKTSMLLGLGDIGMNTANQEHFLKIIHRPHGMVLVTGPTGSGKTTTLYSVLGELNSAEQNIMTVEDPVEYEFKGITQSQVNVKAGLTFASALRSILRQDPDIILIGEIRDMETATIAIQSALTGHMVFSSLHTNDAAGALTRLLDMGVETYLIASSVVAVLAQRLVRKICPKCRIEVPAPAILKEVDPRLQVIYRGKGCKACRNSGYRGRIGIFELLIVDEKVRQLVTEKKSAAEIKAYTVSQGMQTMYQDGLEKVKAGITSFEELMRVTALE